MGKILFSLRSLRLAVHCLFFDRPLRSRRKERQEFSACSEQNSIFMKIMWNVEQLPYQL